MSHGSLNKNTKLRSEEGVVSNDKLHKVIGIDLGTTYSALAVYDTYNEEAILIPDRSEGGEMETIPSVVSLDSSNLHRIIVGYPAKRNIAIRPEETIIEIKREMGELFSQETLQKFNLLGRRHVGEPVEVFFAGTWFYPQEISAFILMKIKDIAQREIGEEIRDAVITVPAYFTERQKKATEEAALLAGLYPRQLIPEPTAAAICYGVDKGEDEKKTYLVYDLGGGTFDVSIIQVEGESIEVISTSGDPRLGGGDFDDAITKWAIGELAKQGVNAQDLVARARIKERAEQAKIALSSFPSTVLDLSFLNPHNPPNLQITRELFEQLIQNDLNKTKTFIDIALNNAETQRGVKREDVNAILLVGGSSKIPFIKKMLLDYFGKEENFVSSEVNPDSVVARGAALMAYRFAQTPPPFDIKKRKESSLMNVDADDGVEVHLITEHSLGVGIQGDLVSRIIEQGTRIPIEEKQGGYTNNGPTDNIPVAVYQGEGKYTYENTLIGILNIGPMEPKPAGYHQFEVVFKLDVNGLLSMTLVHVNEGKTYEAKFDQKTGVGGDDQLVIRRNKLLNLYGPGIQATGSAGSGDGAPPPPDVGQPQSAPPPHASNTAPASDYHRASQNGQWPQNTQPGPPSQAQPQSVPQTPGYQQVPPQDIRWQQSVSPPQQSSAQQQVQSVPEPQGYPQQSVPQSSHPSAPAHHQPLPQPPGDRPAPNEHTHPAEPQQKPPTDQPDLSTVMEEPVTEVPAQFKQMVRRVRKQLFKQFDSELLAMYNQFIKNLNAGYSEEDLADLGDELADLYDDAKQK